MSRFEKPREPDRELIPSQLGKPVRLDGRIVVLLGGGYSWTSRLAFSFAAAGAAVVMGHRKKACGEQVAEEIEAGGGYAAYVPTDPRDAVAVARLYDAVLDEFGHVDIAFNGIEYEGSCQCDRGPNGPRNATQRGRPDDRRPDFIDRRRVGSARRTSIREANRTGDTLALLGRSPIRHRFLRGQPLVTSLPLRSAR